MNVRITTTIQGEEPTSTLLRAEDLPRWVGALLEDATRIDVTYGNDNDRLVTYEVEPA